MLKKRKEVITIFEYPICYDCGGELIEANDMIYTSMPAQKDFKCVKCDKIKRLYESDWPKMIYEYKEKE